MAHEPFPTNNHTDLTATRSLRSSWVPVTISSLALGVSALALGFSFLAVTDYRITARGKDQAVAASLPPQIPAAPPAPAVPTLTDQSSPVPPTSPASLELANLTSADIDIFQGSGEVGAYAFIRPTKQWMIFAADGTPKEVSIESVPDTVRALAEQRAASAVPTEQPVADPGPQAERAQAALPAIANPDPDLAINALLAKPDIASGIISALDRLGTISVPPESDGTKATRLFVFFDPRCPYCHRTFTALDGKVEMVWIPTLALGDDPAGASLAAAILGPVSEGAGVDDKANRNLPDDPARLDRLRTAMRGETLVPGTLTDSGRFILEENQTVLKQLYGRQSNLLAVPTMIQTKPDGSAVAYRGYDESIVTEILDLERATARGGASASAPETDVAPSPEAVPAQ